jgi:hypothetical protein
MWNVSKVREFFRDKDVILVGNNATAVKRPQGEIIDSYDIVLRFGKGIDIREYERELGTKTDVWVTNYFRLPTIGRGLKVPPLVVINGPPPVNRERAQGKERFEKVINHQMYTTDAIKRLQTKWLAKEEIERHVKISSGTLTALWLAYNIDTYKSLTFINFDFFTRGIPYFNGSTEALAVATSWHLSLAKPNYNDFSSVKNMLTHHPSHIGDKEKEMLAPVFARENVHIHEKHLPDQHEYITAPEAPWDSARRPMALKTFETALTIFNPSGSMEKFDILKKRK